MKRISLIALYALLFLGIAGCGIVLTEDGFYFKEKPRLNAVHNPSKYCIYYDGLWGEWNKIGTYYSSYCVKLSQQLQNNYFDIYIYEKGKHPSSFDYKITINYSSYKGVDNDGWHKYDGWIEIRETCVEAKY